jgi:AGCS family alanine or glycine:cation symporter
MDFLMQLVTSINDIVWGLPMMMAILGTGLLLQLRLRFMPVTKIVAGLVMTWKSRAPGRNAPGEISPFAALMTALAATVGTGNIAGVATAVALGGPGALFWMWVTALLGMATKYSEIVLAVHYRETDPNGEQIGGPMYAIKNGLGSRWRGLGAAFALFGGIAGFGVGNMVQANSVAHALQTGFGLHPWIAGIGMAVLTASVLVGGVKRIGAVAQVVVPLMCVGYVLVSVIVLVTFVDRIPGAFALIFKSAFSDVAATGGFAGSAIMIAMRYGVARGIFSNEAGLGTAGIAQAAGQSTNPVESGLVGMMGTFIDTIVICTITGLVLLVTGMWDSGLKGAALTSGAFETALPGFGPIFLAIALTVFAYTTILGWAYYGEKCWEYLLGTAIERPYRIVWSAFIFVGAIVQLDFVWLLADILNALMAIPNLISLALLSSVVADLTRNYFNESGRRRHEGV